MARLKDIAKETGLSISTVSRILSNDPNRSFSDEAIAKVQEAAGRLGYFEKYRMRSKALTTMRLSIACILTSDHETYLSPFFAALLEGVQEEVFRQSSRNALTFHTLYVKDPSFPAFLETTNLDGAIILGRTTIDTIQRLKRSIPTLLYAGVNRLGNGVDEVICDAESATKEAVEHLLALGHRAIGFIGHIPQKDETINEHRFNGYLGALRKAGIEYDDSLVVNTILTATGGYQATKTLISRGKIPTAIFCSNDTVAMGVLKALDEAGIHVPNDLSLIGFDNIEATAFTKPALTTIDIPKRDLGRLAVKTLLDRIESKRTFPVSVRLPFTLIRRESCKEVADE